MLSLFPHNLTFNIKRKKFYLIAPEKQPQSFSYGGSLYDTPSMVSSSPTYKQEGRDGKELGTITIRV